MGSYWLLFWKSLIYFTLINTALMTDQIKTIEERLFQPLLGEVPHTTSIRYRPQHQRYFKMYIHSVHTESSIPIFRQLIQDNPSAS